MEDKIMNTLFNIEPLLSVQGKTCRSCKYRARGKSDEHATRWEQYCTLQPTRRNTVGFKKIKVTNPACCRFIEQKKDKKGNE